MKVRNLSQYKSLDFVMYQFHSDNMPMKFLMNDFTTLTWMILTVKDHNYSRALYNLHIVCYKYRIAKTRTYAIKSLASNIAMYLSNSEGLCIHAWNVEKGERWRECC